MSVHYLPTPANANSPDVAVDQPTNAPLLVNHDLVAALAEQLEYAQKGLITAAAWVTIDGRDGSVDYAWDAADEEQNTVLLGGMIRLEREFERATGADDDE